MPVGAAARRAVGAYLALRGPGVADERLLLNQADERLTTSGITQLLRRIKARAGSARAATRTPFATPLHTAT